VALVRHGGSAAAPIDLRGLPRGAFSVHVRARVHTHGHVRTINVTRRFRTCTRGRRRG